MVLTELEHFFKTGLQLIMFSSAPSKHLLVVVAAAIVRQDGAILLARRPEGKSMAGLWELPGGKIEPGESPEHALARELYEELGVVVDPHLFETLTFASHAYERFHLLMPVYGVTEWQGEITPKEQQQIAFVAPDKLKDYPAPPADIPLFERLLAWSRARGWRPSHA
jgi:8-oxo-dGTP diphosphatase